VIKKKRTCDKVIGIDLLRPHREAVQSDADAMRGNIQALGGPGFGGGP